MRHKEKPMYEFIRSIPVFNLLEMPDKKLDQFEKQIKREVARAQLALRWIQGVRKLKDRKGGEKNG